MTTSRRVTILNVQEQLREVLSKLLDQRDSSSVPDKRASGLCEHCRDLKHEKDVVW